MSVTYTKTLETAEYYETITIETKMEVGNEIKQELRFIDGRLVIINLHESKEAANSTTSVSSTKNKTQYSSEI